MTRQNIDSGRRRALRLLGTTAGVLGAILLVPLRVLAEWNNAAFDATAVADAIKAIGAGNITQSDGIDLKAPEIAENGAIVPVEVTSRLPGTQSVWIIADKNPQPLVAEFTFTEASEPFVSTRIKMSESSRIRVIVKASGKFYETVRDVKVTIGGCGG